jgi:hypothetical protein
MITYLFLSSLFLAILYLLYISVFRHQTFFVRNRLYLLSSMGIAILLPLIQVPGIPALPIEWISSTSNISLNEFSSVSETVKGSEKNMAQLGIATPEITPMFITSFWNWELLYYLGCLVTLVIFCIRLILLGRFLRQQRWAASYTIFSKVYVQPDVPHAHLIQQHEKVHVREAHTLDLFIVQMVRIFFWFNPIVYFMERSLRLQHEYRADQVVAKDAKIDYAEVLIASQFDTYVPVMIHSFAQVSQLKNRLKMLFRKETNRTQHWWILSLLPLLSGMLYMASACQSNPSNEQANEIGEIQTSMDTIQHVGSISDTILKQSNLSLNTLEKKDKKRSDVRLIPKEKIPPPIIDTNLAPFVHMVSADPALELDVKPVGPENFIHWLLSQIISKNQGLKQGPRDNVYFQFEIDENGQVENIRVSEFKRGVSERITKLISESKWEPGFSNQMPIRTIIRGRISINSLALLPIPTENK